MLEKALESPLESKEVKPVSPQGDQPWIFIGRSDAKAEAPILWPPDAKGQLIGKDPDAGKDWGQKEKRVTEDEMVGWHHQLNGQVLEHTPGKPGMLQSMGSQRVRHDWVTQQQPPMLLNQNSTRQALGSQCVVHFSDILMFRQVWNHWKCLWWRCLIPRCP